MRGKHLSALGSHGSTVFPRPSRASQLRLGHGGCKTIGWSAPSHAAAYVQNALSVAASHLDATGGTDCKISFCSHLISCLVYEGRVFT
jgi:hypothetical protein